MRVLTETAHFNASSPIDPQWLTDFNVTVLPNFDPSLQTVIESQIKRYPILVKLFPELKTINFHKNLIVLGKDLTEKIVKTLNSRYQIKWVENYHMGPVQYIEFIKKNQIPVSTTGYLYFHDLYFHALGVQFIPKAFSTWWDENYPSLTEQEQVMMGSIVEWTTLRQVSPMIESMFSPEKWQELAIFFKGDNPQWCNGKTLNQIYKKHFPLMTKILKEWRNQ